MKKFALLFVTIFLITGCAMFEKKSTEEHENEFQVKIEENSSAAEQVKYEVGGNGVVEVSEKYESGSCGKDSDGCGGSKIYTIKSKKAGKTKIIFTKTIQGKVVSKITYNIDVDKNLNIKESHTEKISE